MLHFVNKAQKFSYILTRCFLWELKSKTIFTGAEICSSNPVMANFVYYQLYWISIQKTKIMKTEGCGGGLVVSVLAFYSDDPSSIPAEVYNFSVKLLLKRTKINKKRPGLAQFKKKRKQRAVMAHFLKNSLVPMFIVNWRSLIWNLRK